MTIAIAPVAAKTAARTVHLLGGFRVDPEADTGSQSWPQYLAGLATLPALEETKPFAGMQGMLLTFGAMSLSSEHSYGTIGEFQFNHAQSRSLAMTKDSLNEDQKLRLVAALCQSIDPEPATHADRAVAIDLAFRILAAQADAGFTPIPTHMLMQLLQETQGEFSGEAASETAPEAAAPERAPNVVPLFGRTE